MLVLGSVAPEHGWFLQTIPASFSGPFCHFSSGFLLLKFGGVRVKSFKIQGSQYGGFFRALPMSP